MKWASWVLRALLLLMIVQSVVGANWGSFTKDNCISRGVRKWYSRLWNIQGDWQTACRNTPATVNGQFFNSPNNCVNRGAGGEWGEFWLSDSSCNQLSLFN